MRTRNHRFILIILLSLIIFTPYSEATRIVRLYNSPDMLSPKYNGITRDRDGFLWIGMDRGIMHFDGNVSTFYRNDSNDSTSLSDNRVLRVMSDSKGRVWVGTANGLNLYDSATDSFKRVKIPGMNFGGYISRIIEQNDKTITFLMNGRGLYVVDESGSQLVGVRFLSYVPEENEYSAIVQVPSGRLYAATQTGHVYSIGRNGNVRKIPVTDGYIEDMVVEADGNVLLTSVGDMYRINTKDETVSRIEFPGGIHSSVTNIKEGKDGKIYFTMPDVGILSVGPGETRAQLFESTYSPVIDLSKANLNSLYCDEEGNLWVGCDYAGIALIPTTSTPFTYFGLSNTMSGFKGGIDAMTVADNNIFVSYAGGSIGMVGRDGRVIKTIKLPTYNTITSLVPYQQGTILAGVANEGVWEINYNTGSSKKVIDYPGKYTRISLCVTPDGKIFTSFHGIGLYLYDLSTGSKRKFNHNPQDNKLTNPFVTDMKMSADNKLWIGLYGGLSCYDLNTGQFLEIDQEPFAKGATYSVAPLKDGTVLAGTSHGVLHYHPTRGVIDTYTTADGLTDSDVRAIAIDSAGGKWIGTMKGLSHISPVTGKIDSYYGGYGLYENQFHFADAFGAGERIVLGSDLGLTMFDPAKVPAPGFDSDIKVASVLLNGERLAPYVTAGRNSFVDATGDEPLTLYLPYKDNAVTLVVSTMDFRDVANVRYLWKFKGDKEWRSTQPGESVIHLPHLDPGINRLLIKAIDGNVESKEKEIAIQIETPWYLSTVAYVLYAVLLLVLLLLAYIVVTKRREAKIADDRIKLFIDITHDIRSPITLILNPLKSLINNSTNPDERLKLHMIYRNANRVLSLVNQMLYLRRLDKGKLPLRCRLTKFPDFVEELVEMFKPQAADKKIEIKFTYAGDLPDQIWVDRDNCDKILVNLISNAIKYTPGGGSIDVILSKVEEKDLGPCAKVSVIDTGKGLEPKIEAKIFERFYRGEEAALNIDGFGIGLDLCQRLVTLHHGRISAGNRKDNVKGSEFTILLPLNATAYKEGELLTTEDETAIVEKTDQQLNKRLSLVNKPSDTKAHRYSSGSKRILVVDDDKEMRDYIRLHFEKNYKVDVAVDGAEAFRVINEKKYDLVISDVKMPNMDGYTLLRNIKKNVETNHIPVIILSSKNDVSDRVEGWDRGADGYMGKPFNIEELDILASSLIHNRMSLKGKFSGSQNIGDKIATPEVKGYNEKLMEKVVKIVNDHLDDPELNVEMLGREIGISRAHLHRKLKDIIGMTPSDFIRNVRLKRAVELLKKADVEITTVAYTVGFTSQPHFSTAFKRYTGYSPTEYRNRYIKGDDLSDIDRA